MNAPFPVLDAAGVINAGTARANAYLEGLTLPLSAERHDEVLNIIRAFASQSERMDDMLHHQFNEHLFRMTLVGAGLGPDKEPFIHAVATAGYWVMIAAMHEVSVVA